MLTPDEVGSLADRALDDALDFDIAIRTIAAKALRDPMNVRDDDVRRDIAEAGLVWMNRLNRGLRHTMVEAAKHSQVRDESRYLAAASAGALPPFVPLSESPAMQSALDRGLAGASGYTTHVQSSAAQSVSSAFTDTLERARGAIVSGTTAPNVAVRDAVETIAMFAPRVTYQTAGGGRIEMGLYGAIRRIVLTSVNQTVLRIQDARLLEVGATFVEVSEHMGARPEHAEWQGQVYRFDELPEVCGYGDGAGLGGYNCRHGWWPYFPGINEPTDWLGGDERDNDEQYELSQRQRECERNIRGYKARAAVHTAGGMDDAAARDEALRAKWQREADATARQRSGARRYDRERFTP